MTDNLLELVMIVKNSGEVLRKCLQSVKPFIDRWTIVDTGSVDNTMDIIKEELGEIEGNLYEEKFVDFSTTRNRSLELSSKKCKYTLILDDSYKLYGGDKLRKFLQKNDHSSYSIKIGTLNEKILSSYYYSLRIIKSDANLRYRSKVHEYIPDNTEYIKNTDIFIDDLQDIEHSVRSRNRFKKDIEFLLEEYKENPKDPRTLMYLGKTYILLKEFKEAMIYYKKMQELEDINEEYKFTAYYDAACLDYGEISHSDEKFRKDLLYMQKHFPLRAESYYKLCVFLYENANNVSGNYNVIASIMDKLIDFQKPELYLTVLETNIYDYYIPYLYIDTNLKIGKFDKAVKKLREMLDIYPLDQPLLNIKYAICDKSNYTVEALSKGRTLVIHTGQLGWVWNPTNLKISGSEFMAINMAKEFSKLGYRTFIIGSFEDEKNNIDYQGIYDNVQYIDWKFFPEFSSKYIIDYLIVSRFVCNLLYYENILNVYMWVHDILPHMSSNSPVFQTHLYKFKGFITLSNWHKNYVKEHVGVPENMMILSRNAIYSERFLDYDINKKIPYRFIYISDSYRGLDHLIDMIPKIKHRYPETTLIIYTRKEHIDDQLMNKIQELDYVSLNGRVSQDVIKDELLKSDIWLYPTNFPETYCISALEAMAAGCLVAGVKYAGLADTIGNRGIMCEHPIEKNKDKLLEKLFYVLDRPDMKKYYVEKGREWAMQQTYYNLAIEWIKMFKSR
jgi:tetratricopeptide (TPR) repeat protein